ncbi:metal ABC transporter solute-binding protein, Zn/Mn family [Nakamurella leprariae]|uniref:Zinc ABC transporter substrate-binding protein n=1 Tax=Nakamurella leprariae TaxID=2803911 RepID=A0A938YBF8_9ACTN|nr:zinc ABC transporter substrate-binding protein [Nakamurella leprariae]MBM9466521.1 zinc ABC transporter substrate-binding protein [Nakamurella leprariae]
MVGRARALVTGIAAAGAVALLAGCGSGDAGSSSPSSSPAPGTGPVLVATSTNVWGDVVRQVGGDQVEVTAIISEPSADPHSFEPSAQDQLAVSDAALVVMNGGGYDDFMTRLVDASGTGAPVIDAVEVSGLEGDGHADEHAEDEHAGHDHGAFNEHVWYSFPAVAAVADDVAEHLAELRPEAAETFRANAQAFDARLDELTAQLDSIKATADGTDIGITEPVALYLTEAAGLHDLTPEAFSEAIEGGTDVPVLVLQDTLDLIEGGQIKLLVNNEQTTSAQTEQVTAAAAAAGVPVLEVTETLPEGTDYVGWMQDNIDALRSALGA